MFKSISYFLIYFCFVDAVNLVLLRFGQIKLFGTGKTLEGMAAGFICMLVASIMLDTQLKTEPLNFQGKMLYVT